MGGAREFFRDLLNIKDLLIVVLTPIVLIPFLVVDGGSPEASCAYCVIIMAVFWITEALPIAVTSLVPVFLFPIVGILTIKEVSHEYINDTNMLFIGGLIVAAAIEHWNIHKRIALRILMIVGSETRWLMLGLMAPTWFLSMWISNTATTAMMVPIANAILLQLKDTQRSYNSLRFEEKKQIHDNDGLELEDVNVTEKNPEKSPGLPDSDGSQPNDVMNTEVVITKNGKPSVMDEIPDNVLEEGDDPKFVRLCKCLTLSIAYAANTGGIGSLTGTGPNLVMKGQLEKVHETYGIQHMPITFASWMGFGVPLSFTLLIIVWIWLQILFLRCQSGFGGSDKDRNARVKAVIRNEYEKLGPVTFGQGAIMGHFVCLAVLWITSDMGGEYGWSHIFKKGYVKDGVPAILVATSLFIFPSKIPDVFCRRPDGKREALKPLLSWNAAVKNVPWGVVILLGGGFAMAKASTATGLSAWVGEQLKVLDFLSPWVLNLVLCYIVAAMTEVTSNTATCTLMMPILAELAINLHQNPIYIMFPTALATSFAFMLPVATPPNAVIFSYGYVKVTDMVVAGFILNVICVLVLIGFSETLGDSLFGFHTIPDELQAFYNATSG